MAVRLLEWEQQEQCLQRAGSSLRQQGQLLALVEQEMVRWPEQIWDRRDGMTTNFTGPIPMTPNGGNAMDINDMTSDGDFDKESPPGPGNQQNEVSPANKTVLRNLA